MTVIRPKNLPRVTATTAGDAMVLDGTTTRSIDVVNLLGAIPTAVAVTSPSASALAVGLAGATNPALQVDASTASSATGVKVKSAAAAAGVAISAISSGAAENLTIDAKGTGTVTIGGVSTGQINLGQNAAASGSVLSSSGTGGVGYAVGAGGAVTQITSRTTGVTLNKTSGAITLFAAAAVVGTWVSFTVTNSAVAATDVVLVSVKSGTNTYIATVSAVAAGSFQISFESIVGTASDSPVINFAVIKGVAS